jgi:hypothetical protein
MVFCRMIRRVHAAVSPLLDSDLLGTLSMEFPVVSVGGNFLEDPGFMEK